MNINQTLYTSSFVARLDASGQASWIVSPGLNGDIGVAVDSAGNSTITGGMYGTASSAFGPFKLTNRGAYDVVVARLDPYGTYEWAAQGGGASAEEGRAVAVDGAGAAHVTGYLSGLGLFPPDTLTGTNKDLLVWKLCPSGLCQTCTKDADCDDNLACTTDTCGAAGVCRYKLQAGACKIGGACQASGALSPADKCQRCHPATIASSWSVIPGCYQCGNYKVDPGKEQCDGALLGGATCGSLGYSGGALKCAAKTCVYDESGCTGYPGYYELDVSAPYGSISSSAQSPGYYFEAPAAFTITGLRVPLDVGSAPQSVQVARLAAPLANGFITTNFTTVVHQTGVNSADFITVNIPVKKGDALVIVGGRGAPTQTFSSFGAAPTYSTMVDGQAMVLHRARFMSNTSAAAGTTIKRLGSGELYRVELRYTVP